MENSVKGFRIKIRVLNNPDLRFWMYVDVCKLKQMSDIKKALRLKLKDSFNFRVKKSELNLYMQDYFLPPEEPSIILEKDDILIASIDNLLPDSLPSTIQMSKSTAPQFSSNDIIEYKSTKGNCKDEDSASGSCNEESHQYIPNNESMDCEPSKKSHKTKATEQAGKDVSRLNGGQAEEEYLLSLFPRVPRKKRKNKMMDNQILPPPLPSSNNFHFNKVISNQVKSDQPNSHIRFNDTSIELSTNCDAKPSTNIESAGKAKKMRSSNESDRISSSFQSKPMSESQNISSCNLSKQDVPQNNYVNSDASVNSNTNFGEFALSSTPIECRSLEKSANKLEGSAMNKLNQSSNDTNSELIDKKEMFSHLIALKNSQKTPVFTRNCRNMKKIGSQKRLAEREPQDNISVIYNNCISNTESLSKNIQVNCAPNGIDSFEGAVNMKRYPKIGDVIEFKMLEMSSDYSPEISNFKTAEILEVYYESQEYQIKLLGTERKRKVGKFDVVSDNEDEDLDEQEIILPSILTLKFQDFLDLKFINS